MSLRRMHVHVHAGAEGAQQDALAQGAVITGAVVRLMNLPNQEGMMRDTLVNW